MKILLFFLSVLLFSNAAKTTATLQVEITNIKSKKGTLRMGIYLPNEKFGVNKPGITKIIDIKSTSNQTATFELEPGRYALAIYHDLNGNDAMDKNFVGIPKEPYGFSKNFRPKFSAPSFEDCAFEVLADGKNISVKLTD